MIIEEYLQRNGYRSVDPIIEAVSIVTDVPLEELLDERRGNRYLSDARFLAMFLLRRHRKYLGFQGIAQRLNRNDHATAMHGIAKARHRLEHDERFQRWAEDAERIIMTPPCNTDANGM